MNGSGFTVAEVSQYTVCRACRSVAPAAHVACPEPVAPGAGAACVECGSPEVEVLATRVEAEARAAGLWLKEGWSLLDVLDPYWSPRR